MDSTTKISGSEDPVSPREEDHRLFEAALATLEAADFIPRQEPTLADVIRKDNAIILRWLRARPLTVLLALRDTDDEQFFGNVWVDPVEHTRATAADLVELVHDVAAATDRARELGRINVMFDPGTESSGALSFRLGHDVIDVPFDFDPDFGDEKAQDRILEAFAPAGTAPHLLHDRASARCMVVWARADNSSFFGALDAENQADLGEL